MTHTLPDSRNRAVRLNGALWLALILFALAGLLVVRHLPAWMIALVAAAGVALGTLCFLLHWLVKRRAPAPSLLLLSLKQYGRFQPRWYSVKLTDSSQTVR